MIAFFIVSVASATDHIGADWSGADLTLAAGDTLTGVFTNVARFEVPAGTHASSVPGSTLEVYADEVLIAGTLSATGGGYEGGDSGETGAPGMGPGAGGGASWGEAGAGGAFGGDGGSSIFCYTYYGVCSGPQAAGGGSYHHLVEPLGSGGGGGASHYDPLASLGGAGGGAIVLVAATVSILGTVEADGGVGGCSEDTTTVFSTGEGGGGSGGLVRIDASALTGTGTLSAQGGASCGSGGGGGGGWVVIQGTTVIPQTVLVNGGIGTDPGLAGQLSIDVDRDGLGEAEELAAGTDPHQADSDGDTIHDGDELWRTGTDPSNPDTDGDGVNDSFDPCPLGDADSDGVCDFEDLCVSTPDPFQLDSDGDGLGDACDACYGFDPSDADSDGWCDDFDNCPSAANLTQADVDEDGAGDACDACEGDDAAGDRDGDAFCNDVDLCPDTFDPLQDDRDYDGIGDLCDRCPDIPGIDQPFGAGATFFPTNTYEQAAAMDFDLDGDLDVVASVQDRDWELHIIENDGGVFLPPVQLDSLSSYNLATGDIDGDGDDDIIVSSGGVHWYENVAGAFSPRVMLWEYSGRNTLQILDIDGDGDLDIVEQEGSPTKDVIWWSNLGGMAFAAEAFIMTDTYEATFFDLDGDGDLDASSYHSWPIDAFRIYENTGTQFTVAQTLPGSTFNDEFVMDIDADGDPDILGGTASSYSVMENVGGTMSMGPVVLTSIVGTGHWSTADLDGDGDLDILNATYWHENLGGSVFASPQAIHHDELDHAYALGDLNGDGMPDFIGSNGAGAGWMANFPTPADSDDDGICDVSDCAPNNPAMSSTCEDTGDTGVVEEPVYDTGHTGMQDVPTVGTGATTVDTGAKAAAGQPCGCAAAPSSAWWVFGIRR